MKFQESKLAHKYCIGKGLEIGAAAHNPFGLADCKFLAHWQRSEFWKQSEINTCGEFVQPDRYGDAENIPWPDNAFDYVISSHVIEHVPNPIKAFLEWNRVLVEHGIIFIIFPKRNADPNDVNRPVSELGSFISQFFDSKPLTDEKQHIWIFTLRIMLQLMDYCNNKLSLGWKILEALETDDKVGNGSLIVARKI